VRGLQKELSAITGSHKCLEDWLPHITVGDGITVSEEMMVGLENELTEISHSQHRVTARIKGFGGIENWKGAVEGKITSYVIWLEVEVSSDLLQLYNNLREKVTLNYGAWLPRTTNYTPHVTLAFADLTQKGYDKGIEYLASQKIDLPFSISHLAVVECYGEGNMTSVEYKKFYLKK
jgi:2'-5' RNA ligase